MNDTRYWRQLDVINQERLSVPITVIGCGAIGSFTVLALTKMGCSNITVYDDDLVSEHNLPNQFFREKDLGKPKVFAIAEIAKEFDGFEVKPINRKFIDDKLSGIVVVAVDSIDIRKNIWRRVKPYPLVEYYIDGRMGAEVGLIYAFNPADIDAVKNYEQSLHPSSESYPARCTERAIIYTVLGISCHICLTVKKYLMSQPVKEFQFFDFS